MNQLKKIILFALLLTIIILLPGHTAMADLNIVHSQTQKVVDADGEVSVRVDWLERPGEMAITITYYGYLTQEGMANVYLNVNGEAREFLTMKKELKNRAQRLRIISFHPTVVEDGINKLSRIPDDSMVDSLLFKNAPYYQQFGELVIEAKFFCHGRWDGDGNNNNENYRFVFTSPVKGFAMDHF
ncbi:MAG: hypothetical protein AB1403_20025 [Candidatus Riflebacteria bacterium]